MTKKAKKNWLSALFPIYSLGFCYETVRIFWRAGRVKATMYFEVPR